MPTACLPFSKTFTYATSRKFDNTVDRCASYDTTYLIFLIVTYTGKTDTVDTCQFLFLFLIFHNVYMVRL